MTVIIEQIDDVTFTVDGIEIRKSNEGAWIGNPELSQKQIATFQRHLQAVEQFGLKGKAEYKV